MNVLERILGVFAEFPWLALVGFLAVGLIVAITLQVIKHLRNIEDKKLITFLLGLLSFLPAFLDYVINLTAQNPTVLGSLTAKIVMAATFMHRFVVSPLYHRLVIYLEDARAGKQLRAPAEGSTLPQEEFAA
jgi:hypothetical protein